MLLVTCTHACCLLAWCPTLQLIESRKYVERHRKLTKPTIVERYASFGSTTYAPVQRDGRFPETKPTVGAGRRVQPARSVQHALSIDEQHREYLVTLIGLHAKHLTDCHPGMGFSCPTWSA
jgi:hypothetical protein